MTFHGVPEIPMRFNDILDDHDTVDAENRAVCC